MPGTNSLERMLSVLAAFNDDRLEWTPDELISHFGFSRPTLYRYLKILTDAGLLASLPPGRYMLGPRVVEMDYLLRMSDPLILAGSDVAEALAMRFEGTALLMRWYGNRLVCVHNATAPNAPMVNLMRGKPMEMRRGSTVRVIIAAMPRRKALPLVQRLLEDFSDTGIGNNTEAVFDALREVRRRGFATSTGEVMPGITGTSAPILDASRMPVGALCLTQHAERVDPANIDSIARPVIAGAEAISRALASRA